MCGIQTQWKQIFFDDVEPIRLKDSLAIFLGAIDEKEEFIFTFTDVIKMAGHACPTIAGAYLCCQEALKKLYPDEIPKRGEISITVYGEPDEGVYGVMAQVFSFITGAAAITGFKGLGTKFKRKELLKFSSGKIDSKVMCFGFKRLDTNKSVLVKFYPWKISFPEEKGNKLGELLEKTLWDAAKNEEIEEFQILWMEKVKNMLIERKEIDNWLKVEEN